MKKTNSCVNAVCVRDDTEGSHTIGVWHWAVAGVAVLWYINLLGLNSDMVYYTDNNGLITVELLKEIGIIIKKQTNKHTQNPVCDTCLRSRHHLTSDCIWICTLHLDLYIALDLYNLQIVIALLLIKTPNLGLWVKIHY